MMGGGFEGEGGELRILSERAREQVLRDRALLEDLALALALLEPKEQGEAGEEDRKEERKAPRDAR